MKFPESNTSVLYVSKTLSSDGPSILRMRLGVLHWGTGYTNFSLLEARDAELLTTQFAAAGGTVKVKLLWSTL